MKYLQQNVQRERKQKRRKPSAHFNYYRICSKIRDPSIIILIIITNSVSLTHKFLRHYFFLLRLLFCFCAVRQVCACLGTYYLKKYFFLISSKWLFWSISLLEFMENVVVVAKEFRCCYRYDEKWNAYISRDTIIFQVFVSR